VKLTNEGEVNLPESERRDVAVRKHSNFAYVPSLWENISSEYSIESLPLECGTSILKRL
jgi:hypothetical protein